MDCRNALKETNGDKAEALKLLLKQGFVKAQKTAGRVAKQGMVASYIHAGGRIGALVEVNTETDFVARTAEFQELAHSLAMQVAAMAPEYLSERRLPYRGGDRFPECLSAASTIHQGPRQDSPGPGY